MQLLRIKITGYRGYKDTFSLEIDENLTALTGVNDAGKTTVLEALESFFADRIDSRDFSATSPHDQRVDQVIIECVFGDLPRNVIIDSSFKTTLNDEFLLDMDGNLHVQKMWSRSRLTSPQISVYAHHPTLQDRENQSDLHSMKQSSLKSEAKACGLDISTIKEDGDARTNAAYRRKIWENWLSSGEARLQERYVPLNRDDALNVARSLASYYPLFHLFRSDRASDETEPIAQDPIKLVIKQVLAGHAEQLSQLSAAIGEEINAKLLDVTEKLQELAPALASTLRAQEVEPKWTSAYGKAEYVDDHGIPLSKRGSGTRRLVLLSFFRAEAEADIHVESDDNYDRGVILAIEEPETALHPDLQRKILSSLLDISDRPRRQVILTSHSVNLLQEIPATSIRYVRLRDSRRECIVAPSLTESQSLLEALRKSMGILSDHQVRCFVLLEGRNDKASLLNLSQAIHDHCDSSHEPLSVLESRGILSFMPIGGCGSLSLWESTLMGLHRPEVLILDSDRTTPESPLKGIVSDYLHTSNPMRKNIVLERRELENYLTMDSILAEYAGQSGFADAFAAVQPDTLWEYADIPNLVAKCVHNAGRKGDGKIWEELADDKRKDKESKAKRRLASSFSHHSVATEVWGNEASDLRKIITTISEFCCTP